MRNIIYIFFLFFHISLSARFLAVPLRAALAVLLAVITFNVTAQSITWQRTYGGPVWEEGRSIIQTPDSGYIAVGLRYVSPTGYLYAIRINKYGDVIWERTYPFESARQIERTSDNNYIIMSRHSLLKININGDTLWSKRQFDIDTGYTSIKETIDNGFIISGYVFSGPAITYPYLLRINTGGSLLWEKIYTDSIYEGNFSDLTISEDNNFIVCGNISNSPDTITAKLTITKIDTNGNIIWWRRYDSLKYYSANSICKSNDGGYIIGGGGTPWLSKFNSTGSIQWLNFYDTSFNSGCYSVIKTFDENYVYAGYWDTNGTANFYTRLRKVDNNGNEIWRRSYGFAGTEYATEVRQTYDSGFIIMAFTEYGVGNYDMFIIKSDKNGNAAPYIGIEPSSSYIPQRYEFYQNYPNPFNSQTKLKFDIPYKSNVNIIIYNVLGQAVVTLVNENLKAGSYKTTFDTNNLPSGIYFARIIASSQTTSYSKTQKLILVK